MEPGELECPWPAGGIDLCLVELSSSEKLWLANQIVLKLQTTRELANLYNLKMDSLRQYARHLREHKPMLKCGERPVAIDATGLEELSETLQVHPNMAKELLHAVILTVHRYSCYMEIYTLVNSPRPLDVGDISK